MDQRSIAVVVVSYFTGPVLFDAIESALAQGALTELIIVDNGNPAAISAALWRRALRDPRIVVLGGHGNLGYAAGANLGARNATSDCLLFMNPDCILPPGALARFREVAEGWPGPVILGPRVANVDGSEQRGSRRAALTPRTAVVEALRLDRLLPRLDLPRLNTIDRPAPAAPREIPAVSGACMFVSADDFRALGGFDKRYFLHVDDLDICLQAGRRGGRVVWIPDVTVIHYGGTSDASPIVVEWHKARGFAKYFRKHFRGSHGALAIAALSLLGYLRLLGKAPALCLRSISRLVRDGIVRPLCRPARRPSFPARRTRHARGGTAAAAPHRLPDAAPLSTRLQRRKDVRIAG